VLRGCDNFLHDGDGNVTRCFGREGGWLRGHGRRCRWVRCVEDCCSRMYTKESMTMDYKHRSIEREVTYILRGEGW
jgi:hypothetical protein